MPRRGLYFPIEIRANVGTALAANLADELRLDVGQPDAVGPPLAANRYVVTAPVIGTIDQQSANASGAHLFQRDLLVGEGGHCLAIFIAAECSEPVESFAHKTSKT